MSLIWILLLLFNFANASNVLHFNPTDLDVNFNARDIVKINYTPSNFSQGFSICFRFSITTWRSSCLLQSDDNLITLVILDLFFNDLAAWVSPMEEYPANLCEYFASIL